MHINKKTKQPVDKMRGTPIKCIASANLVPNIATKIITLQYIQETSLLWVIWIKSEVINNRNIAPIDNTVKLNT